MTAPRFAIAVLAVSAAVAGAVALGMSSRPGATTAQAAPARAAAPAAAAVAGRGAAALQQAFVNAFRYVSPSVVQIETSSGLGSGIVFDRKGDIVTNDHVVGSAKTFTVTTSGGKQLKGTLVGTFVPDDLAVIKVPGAGLHPARFADSSRLRVGDITMAIGNPLGLSSSVTEGIVSALQRTENEGNGVTLPDTIQTSAAINPGNSGGALVDVSGSVIGIPTLAAADPQLGGAAAGIGFAIPSNVVRDIARQIVENGHVVNSHRAYLGISVGDTGEGVFVGSVSPGSPAARAGMKVGDLITALDGTPTPTAADLGSVLATLKPGQKVTAKITRQNGSSTTVTVTLGQYPGT